MTGLFYTFTEVMTLLNISEDQLKELVTNGDLVGHRGGGSAMKFKAEDVHKLEQRLQGGETIADPPPAHPGMDPTCNFCKQGCCIDHMSVEEHAKALAELALRSRRNQASSAPAGEPTKPRTEEEVSTAEANPAEGRLSMRAKNVYGVDKDDNAIKIVEVSPGEEMFYSEDGSMFELVWEIRKTTSGFQYKLGGFDDGELVEISGKKPPECIIEKATELRQSQRAQAVAAGHPQGETESQWEIGLPKPGEAAPPALEEEETALGIPEVEVASLKRKVDRLEAKLKRLEGEDTPTQRVPRPPIWNDLTDKDRHVLGLDRAPHSGETKVGIHWETDDGVLINWDGEALTYSDNTNPSLSGLEVEAGTLTYIRPRVEDDIHAEGERHTPQVWNGFKFVHPKEYVAPPGFIRRSLSTIIMAVLAVMFTLTVVAAALHVGNIVEGSAPLPKILADQIGGQRWYKEKATPPAPTKPPVPAKTEDDQSRKTANAKLDKLIGEIETTLTAFNSQLKKLEKGSSEVEELKRKAKKELELVIAARKEWAELKKQKPPAMLEPPTPKEIKYNGNGWPIKNVLAKLENQNGKTVLNLSCEGNAGVKADHVDIGKVTHNPNLDTDVAVTNVKLEDDWIIVDIVTKEKIDTSHERFKIKLQLR